MRSYVVTMFATVLRVCVSSEERMEIVNEISSKVEYLIVLSSFQLVALPKTTLH